MIKSILIVCIGNICRSPMAAALLAQELPDVELRSAGIDALIGQPAAPYSIELMQRRDIDISAHRAQQLQAWQCEIADLILVMDTRQKQIVEEQYPTTRGKLYRLGQYGKFDVFDPYRLDRDQFEDCLRLIEQGVADWVSRIHSINQSLPEY
ncbi:low molecular weight protein-tyrosine-phosphatase [Collimonas silvisoli]|uniref:low molecular weight protein-tyrosine-phosphatase n=1 Tax=Collimonas silvisoli TaxID=2825884 RepID=UPI001B8C7D23|nr:low molecular weight protein-tyrosine-phosphatase [Collimonas silvisoli]